MILQATLFLSAVQQVIAAPRAIVTLAPNPVLPSICGVLSGSPACPTGHQCQPYVTRYCSELEPDELCGYCSPTSPQTTTLQPPNRGWCPSGYTPDPRDRCIKITTKTPVCRKGFAHDANGSCRPVPTPDPQVVKKHVDTTVSRAVTCDLRRGPKCPEGFWCKPNLPCLPLTPFCAGTCVDTPPPWPKAVEKRVITTLVKKDLVCDVRRDPECPSGLWCKPNSRCLPLSPFCPGTCVDLPPPRPTAIEKREEGFKCDTRQDRKCPDKLWCSEIAPCPPFIAFCPGTCTDSLFPKPTAV